MTVNSAAHEPVAWVLRLMTPTRLFMLLLLCWIAGSGAGCATASPAAKRFEFSEIIMGVEARLVIFADSEPHARTAGRAAFDRMIELDGVMSDYRSNSELMRVVAEASRAPGTPVPISDDLLDVLSRSQEIARLSGGAFDVTIGPVAGLWRQARREQRLPDHSAIEQTRLRVGWEKLQLDANQQTLSLTVPDMRLDLGGIGKGYAADAALSVLQRHGCTSALVDLGGDLALGDAPPGCAGWTIAVQSGEDDAGSLELANVGVATSGDTAQYIEVDGVRYSHIVDPRIGIGLTNRVAVTVVAPDATTADALASAISVLGEAEGLALARQFSEVHATVRALGSGR